MVVGNTIQGTFTQAGIGAGDHPEFAVTIRQNTITLNATTGNAMGIAANRGRGLEISENTITNKGSGYYGITLMSAHVSGVSIRNNKVSQFRNSAIHADDLGTPGSGPSNLEVVQNTLIENGGGVSLQKVEGRNTILGNEARSSRTPAGRAYFVVPGVHGANTTMAHNTTPAPVPSARRVN
jgi:hypothetical protein